MERQEGTGKGSQGRVHPALAGGEKQVMGVGHYFLDSIQCPSVKNFAISTGLSLRWMAKCLMQVHRVPGRKGREDFKALLVMHDICSGPVILFR